MYYALENTVLWELEKKTQKNKRKKYITQYNTINIINQSDPRSVAFQDIRPGIMTWALLQWKGECTRTHVGLWRSRPRADASQPNSIGSLCLPLQHEKQVKTPFCIKDIYDFKTTTFSQWRENCEAFGNSSHRPTHESKERNLNKITNNQKSTSHT